MPTPNVVQVKDSSALLNGLVNQLTGRIPVQSDDLSNILTWGSKEFSALDVGSQKIITSTMATLVTSQEVVGPYVPETGLNIVKSEGAFENHAAVVQRLRLAMPDRESDTDVYNPDPATYDPSRLFRKKPINIDTTYYFKTFAHCYTWTEGARWFSGLLLNGKTLGDIYAMMRQQVVNAQRMEEKAQSLALIRSSMMLNLATLPSGGLTTVGTPQAVNLLARYNAEFGTNLTKEKAFHTAEFLAFAGREMEQVYHQITDDATKYFNEMGWVTAAQNTMGYFNSEFVASYKRHFLIDKFNAELGGLTEMKTINWWKSPAGAGPTISLAEKTRIKDSIKVSWNPQPIEIDVNYVIGTIIDAERIGIYNWGVENAEQEDGSALSKNYFSHCFGTSLCDPFYNAVTFYLA